jgi:pseudouridine synthase
VTRERLQKIIAASGYRSRRAAEALIAAGEVRVNGAVATLGQTADADVDRISIAGHPLEHKRGERYLALNKPVGYISTTQGRPGELTVMNLVPADARVYPVGRLDRDTSGLLFLTGDGDWAQLITHPRFEVEKEYEVQVAGAPSREALQRLRLGVRLPDGSTSSPARVDVVGGGRDASSLRVVVHEGKKRQIRLMLAAVGHPVRALRRVRIGSVQLGTLLEGQWRDLAEIEVESFRASRRPDLVETL